MLTIDTILQNRYRIVRLLGQGGMGAVYQALDERIDKTVAVKEILLELENSSNQEQALLIKQAFRREASSLVKARHETVPDVTDYFSDGDREFLVMEFIEGDDLMKMLQKRKKPFAFEEVLPWIDQLLEALDYLHNLESPIIHRDIKPQNLKLNEWNKIKLLDFGIAKSTDKSATITQMTFVGATLDYSPIEQILRVIDPMFRELILLKHKEEAERILAQDTDSRCDIFALGATFYHLLTNYPPVDIKKRTLETWEGKGDPLPNPSEINSELTTAISDWLIKAMAIERDDRFSSATEMRKVLKNIVAQEAQRKQEEERISAIESANPQNNEIKSDQEQNLMHAQTVRLIELPETDEPEKEKFSQTSSSQIESPDTFSSVDISSTDLKFSNTDISGFDTADELSEISSIGNDYAENQDKTELNVKENIGIISPGKIKTESATANNFNYILILAITGILAFAVVGGGLFGFVVWMNYPSESKSVIENSNTNISETPEAAITPETLSSSESGSNSSEAGANSSEVISDSNSETVSDTPGSSKTPVGTTKPVTQPTPKPVVRQTPRPIVKPEPTTVKTPKPIKPTPTRKNLTDDCVYNGKCQ